MKFGICSGPEAAAQAHAAGFDYLEINVQAHLRPTQPESEFHACCEQLKKLPIPCRAANCFLPGHLKVTGPEVNWDTLEHYVGVALARAERVGIQYIVFGSGASRKVPDGFSREVAWSQLSRFARLCNEIAHEHGVMIVLEPLQRGETNIVNSVTEGARLVQEVDLPHFRLLVDAFHWAKEEEPVSSIVQSGSWLRHAHIATYAQRKAPGLEACDFQPFFKALQTIGYQGMLSIEGAWNDFALDAAPALAVLRSAVHSAQ